MHAVIFDGLAIRRANLSQRSDARRNLDALCRQRNALLAERRRALSQYDHELAEYDEQILSARLLLGLV